MISPAPALSDLARLSQWFKVSQQGLSHLGQGRHWMELPAADNGISGEGGDCHSLYLL